MVLVLLNDPTSKDATLVGVSPSDGVTVSEAVNVKPVPPFLISKVTTPCNLCKPVTMAWPFTPSPVTFTTSPKENPGELPRTLMLKSEP